MEVKLVLFDDEESSKCGVVLVLVLSGTSLMVEACTCTFVNNSRKRVVAML